MMLRLNLLPWRERQRRAAVRRFKLAVLATVLFAFCGVMLLDHLARQRLQNQVLAIAQSQVMLQGQQAELARIDALRERREAIQAQSSALARLWADQGLPLVVFAEFERAMPEGLNLSELTLQDNRVQVLGLAASPAVLAQLMRELEQSAVLQGLELKRLRNVPAGEEFLLLAQVPVTWS
ncbi:PilN domain-containing protein [Pseudomonas putida]|uniref:PilN domain-containing protein n=1 Tax=Pseudomonas TaxID=286 RepID=UPI00346602CB